MNRKGLVFVVWSDMTDLSYLGIGTLLHLRKDIYPSTPRPFIGQSFRFVYYFHQFIPKTELQVDSNGLRRESKSTF